MDMFDEFPEKKQPNDRLDKRVDIDSVMPIIKQVVQFLMTKAIHEMRKQDKYNPTLLANVSFHLEYNVITKETRLAFDKHPSAWKIKELMFEMLNVEADIMMANEANADIPDNPFTY
jgi:hypothetical protein